MSGVVDRRTPGAAGVDASAVPPSPQAQGPEPDRGPRWRSVPGFVAQVVGWLVILGFLLVLAATVVVPRVADATPYTVLTSSMEPKLPPGALVVARPTAPDDIKIGEVATFQIRSGEPQVVTHRVVAVRPGDDGEPEFLTQGDANRVVDEGWRSAESVRGVVWYSLPKVGYAHNVLTGHQRQLAVHVVAGGLLLYAVGLFAGAARDRRRRS